MDVPEPHRTAPGVELLGRPRDGLTEEELARFELGRAAFERSFVAEGGLGPYYNDSSCAGCHGNPAFGGSGERDDTVTIGADPDIRIREFPRNGLPGYPPPPEPTETAVMRLPPPLWGLGQLSELPSELSYETCTGEENERGVRGVVYTELGAPLRFGFRPFHINLDNFIREAFRAEMGVTAFPCTELCPDGDDIPDPEVETETVGDVAFYVRNLAPPPPGPDDPAGLALFEATGCTDCHVPSLGGVDGVYSNLCSHWLGDRISDSMPDGEIPGHEWRTAPLWGLRFRPYLLHDGRASSVEEALDYHEGEAQFSKDAYLALPEADRAKLIAFVNAR